MNALVQWVGASSLLAAAATVVGAVTLLLFFARGDPWGKLNDASSVVLMLGTVPVAVYLAVIERDVVGQVAFVTAAVGIAAMMTAAVLQAALVVGRVTYDQTKLAVLGAGAVVGAWYLISGLLMIDTGLPDWLSALAIAAGIGFIAVGIGFVRGAERHPAAQLGGLVLFLSSTTFLVWMGLAGLGGNLPAPASG